MLKSSVKRHAISGTGPHSAITERSSACQGRSYTHDDNSAKLSHVYRPDWLLNFDEERHTYEVFRSVKEKIEREGYSKPTLPSEQDHSEPSLE